MKTNQVLTRKMGDFDVNQRTSDGMFNATELLKQWNSKSGQQKKLDHFFENKSTEEFINAIISEENHNTRNSVYLKTRGKNGGTLMHPILFIDFAMWLNPKFKVKVLTFVYDELIKNRHDAGDNYKVLSKSVSKIVKKSFLPIAIQNVAKGINYVVFNKHEAGIRNSQACEKRLKELSNLEVKLSELIEDEFITTYDDLMKYLRKQWNNKYQPKILKIA